MKTETQANEPTIPVCSTCLSANVTCDAVARWSADNQRWELSSEFDNTDCDDCGGECRLEWLPVGHLSELRAVEWCPICGNPKDVGGVMCHACADGYANHKWRPQKGSEEVRANFDAQMQRTNAGLADGSITRRA